MKKKLLVLILTIITLGTAEIIKAADYIWPIDSSNAYETRIEYGYGKRQYDSKAYDTMYENWAKSICDLLNYQEKRIDAIIQNLDNLC